ncbi:MAG TPA: hypothetical protein PLU45_08055 [Bacteroidales bacterium]|nr:hypothetical protein [Bacteroidales bacterium]
MTVQDINKAKVPVVKINNKLDKFRNTVLFPKKVEMANKMLENAVLPKPQ